MKRVGGRGGRETRSGGKEQRQRGDLWVAGADGFGLVIQVTPGSLDIRQTEKEFFRSSI